jgi:hypothetical protein
MAAAANKYGGGVQASQFYILSTYVKLFGALTLLGQL